MQAILHTLLEEFRTMLPLTYSSVARKYQFHEAKNVIKVAIGMRRSGKTYFLFQTIRELQSAGIPLEKILYINFEDDRILPMNTQEMGKLIDAWYTLYPENHTQCCYLFLDEVQNVEGWPLVLRRLLDTKNIQIYVTGSSAKLLSKEIATSLRGRSLSIEIFPYDYSEYLTAHALNPPSKPLGKKTLDEQRNYLIKYFYWGGFPGVQCMQPNEQLETLQNYVETVIFRDIIERYQIKNINLLKYLIQSLLKNVATPFSINKFYNDSKSQGHKVAKDTLYSYLGYLEDAFLIFSVPIFSESLRQVQSNPKKIYAIDTGLVVANTFNLSDNLGKLFENQVYLTLRRQGKKIFYYQTSSGYEIDFVTQDKEGKHEFIQVAWEITDPATREREERAIRQAESELGFSGRILDFPEFIKTIAENSPSL